MIKEKKVLSSYKILSVEILFYIIKNHHLARIKQVMIFFFILISTGFTTKELSLIE